MPPRKKVVVPPVVAPPSANTRSSRSKTKAAAAESDAPQTKPSSRPASTRDAQVVTRAPAAPKNTSKRGNKSVPAKPVKDTTRPTGRKPSGTTVINPEAFPRSESSKASLPQIEPSVRTPPAEDSPEPEPESLRTQAVPTKKPKQAVDNKPPPTMRKRSREVVEQELEDTPQVQEPKPKKGRTVQNTKRPSKRSTAFSATACAAWFASYADPQDSDTMTPEMSNQWLQDLGINEESAAYFVIAWKMNAKSMFTLSKSEFTVGMAKLGVDCNEKLLQKLPDILKQTDPASKSSDFNSFYKFCFEYGKSGGPPGAKNVDLAVATEFLNMALDSRRYSIDYRPDPEPRTTAGERALGEFSHTNAFIEFLKSAGPVKVMNRDQWDSFLPFNKSVSWGLEGYSEDGAWPSLFDQYVDWRRLKYPESVTSLPNADQAASPNRPM